MVIGQEDKYCLILIMIYYLYHNVSILMYNKLKDNSMFGILFPYYLELI